MSNVIKISPEDNVGVVIDEIKKGDHLKFTENDGKSIEFKALDDIRIYHKVAIVEIKADEHIVKYGEHIGVAGKNIAVGEHVHVHNVLDKREDLSLVE